MSEPLNATLKRSIALEELAMAIYAANRAHHDPELPEWPRSSYLAKEECRNAALALIELLRQPGRDKGPRPIVITGFGRIGRVIGTIGLPVGGL